VKTQINTAMFQAHTHAADMYQRLQEAHAERNAAQIAAVRWEAEAHREEERNAVLLTALRDLFAVMESMAEAHHITRSDRMAMKAAQRAIAKEGK
jgi:hypothetical protein